jgi:hypothetical protein
MGFWIWGYLQTPQLGQIGLFSAFWRICPIWRWAELLFGQVFAVVKASDEEDLAIFQTIVVAWVSRHMVMIKVVNLTETLRDMQESGLQPEHIHEY